MPEEGLAKVVDVPALRARVSVFRDRAHAGEVLAGLLECFRGSGAVVLAIPAGGHPVATVIARRLGLELDVAVVSKITPSWDSETGYGAVAFDGIARIDEGLAAAFDIGREERRRGTEIARRKVCRRVARLRGGDPAPRVAQRPVILVDDGLASGTTMLAAIEAIERLKPAGITVAVPTAHVEAARRVAGRVGALYVANLRSGPRFAVADAYESWRDVTDRELPPPPAPSGAGVET